MNFTVYVKTPSCSINAYDGWDVAAKNDVALTASFVNTDTVQYYYRWDCLNSTARNAPLCGLQTNASANSTLVIKANSMVAKKAYTWTLRVLNSNNETINTCSKVINVAAACASTPATIVQTTPYALGYLDRTVQQTFLC
jgi:hypothetical protein